MGGVLLGKFMGKILGCPFAIALILDWKQVLSCIKWAPSNPRAHSLPQESIYWSAFLNNQLAYQEPGKTYLSKTDIRQIDDVVDDQRHLLTIPTIWIRHASQASLAKNSGDITTFSASSSTFT